MGQRGTKRKNQKKKKGVKGQKEAIIIGAGWGMMKTCKNVVGGIRCGFC